MLTSRMSWRCAPPRALDQLTDVLCFRSIQGLREAVAPFEIRLSFCALEENDADAPLFLKRVSDPINETAIILSIDDTAIHELAADLAKLTVLINCRDNSMRLNAIMPDHRQVGEFATSTSFTWGTGASSSSCACTALRSNGVWTASATRARRTTSRSTKRST
jgi:hypothetical protein